MERGVVICQISFESSQNLLGTHPTAPDALPSAFVSRLIAAWWCWSRELRRAHSPPAAARSIQGRLLLVPHFWQEEE